MKLKQIAQFSSGLNSLELKKSPHHAVTYTNDDMEIDLYQGYWSEELPIIQKAVANAGNLIINMMTNRAAVVSPLSVGKLLPQHIMQLSLDNQQVDAWYLCYVFNESHSVKRQLYSTMEGTVLRRVTATSIKNLNIKLPPLEEQRQIGKFYRTILIQERLQREYLQKLNQLYLTILNKNDLNGGK